VATVDCPPFSIRVWYHVNNNSFPKILKLITGFQCSSSYFVVHICSTLWKFLNCNSDTFRPRFRRHKSSFVSFWQWSGIRILLIDSRHKKSEEFSVELYVFFQIDRFFASIDSRYLNVCNLILYWNHVLPVLIEVQYFAANYLRLQCSLTHPNSNGSHHWKLYFDFYESTEL
jgi:hypothetical protein